MTARGQNNHGQNQGQGRNTNFNGYRLACNQGQTSDASVATIPTSNLTSNPYGRQYNTVCINQTTTNNASNEYSSIWGTPSVVTTQNNQPRVASLIITKKPQIDAPKKDKKIEVTIITIA